MLWNTQCLRPAISAIKMFFQVCFHFFILTYRTLWRAVPWATVYRHGGCALSTNMVSQLGGDINGSMDFHTLEVFKVLFASTVLIH